MVLPSGGRFHDTVLRDLYDATLGGYLGSNKTLKALQACVWWLHMLVDVEVYVVARPMCQKVKDHTTAKLGL